MKKTSIDLYDKKKIFSINFLYLNSLIIIFLGMFFSIFSFINHINFKVLNSSIPGAVLGFLVLYLGLRYYISLAKLKEKLFKSSSQFSWSNFKRKKTKS